MAWIKNYIYPLNYIVVRYVVRWHEMDVIISIAGNILNGANKHLRRFNMNEAI